MAFEPKFLRVILFVIVIGALSYWVKKTFFVDDKAHIERRLTELSDLFRRTKSDNPLAMAQRTVKALEYFKTPVEIQVIGETGYKKTFSEEAKSGLQQTIASAQFRKSWVNVKIEDLFINLRDGEAESTFIVRLEFEHREQGLVYDEYPLRVDWIKVDKEWFIRFVELDILEKNSENQ